MKYFNLLFALIPFCVFSQTATIDETFMPGYNSEYKQYIGEHCVPAPNGKLWALTTTTNNAEQRIIRLFADGKIDDSYVPFLVPGFVTEIKSNQDGSFVATLLGYPQNIQNFFKFSSDGVLDTNFTAPIFYYNNESTYPANGHMLKDMVFDDDGKMVIVGNFSQVNGIYRQRIVRLNSDGSVDTTFNVGTGFNGFVNCIKKYGANKYVIGGNFTTYDGISKIRVIRLNYDGSIDNTFHVNTTYNQLGINNGLEEEIDGIGVQSNGMIITTGSRFFSNNNPVTGVTVRFTSTGTRDSSFSNTANVSSKHMLVLSDDKLFFGHQRLNSNGTVDTTFSYTGNIDNTNTAGDSANFPTYFVYDNKIYYNRNYLSAQGISRYRIHRRNLNGTFDITFNPHSGFNFDYYERNYYSSDKNYYIKTLPDGKFIVAGIYSSYNDVPCKKISRFTYDGELDTTFNLDPIFTTYNILLYPNAVTINSIEAQSDGKLIFSGTTLINNQTKYAWRINPDGSYDPTFNITSNGKVKVLNNDKFLFLSSGIIKRYNSDGTLDNTFSSGLAEINNFSVQNDNKILCNRYSSDPSLRRLNENGSIDSSFQSIYFNNCGIGIARQLNDDKILFSYKHLSNNGIYLRKFNSDGTPDTSFPTPLSTPNYEMRYVLNSGNILQQFNSYTSTLDRLRIFNPNTNTVADSFVSVPTSTNGDNFDFDIQECDKIIAVGYFEGIDGSQYSNMVRYNLSAGGSAPPPTGSQNQTFTQGQTLADLTVTGENILWYSNQNACFSYVTNKNANAQNSTNSLLPITTILENGVTYYASQTINGVESFYRLPVKATSALSLNSYETNSLTYYPNPVSNELNIKSDTLIDRFEVSNLLGQIVSQKSQKSNEITIDFSNLNTGIYFVKIFTEEQTKTIKISKK